jgi:phage FluMu gp28-like protein
MTLSDPNSSASITGKTANPDAGRGGTRNAIFMDEMAFMQYAQQINRSASSNTPCRIFNSTPNGEGNEFYRMKQQALTGRIKWLRYHWTEHPFYDTEWYNAKIKGMTKETIAQELEIDYNTAIV